MFSEVFYEISLILGITIVLGLIGYKLKFPLLISFIIVGIISGPNVLNIITTSEHLDLLSKIGISILLFLVGLKIDVQMIKSVGNVAIATGLGQITFTTIIGFIICLLLKIPSVAALYISIAISFSSTIIIIKLLSDKHELDSLHGRISIGFLIIQDLFVIFAMFILSGLGMMEGENINPMFGILKLIGYSAIFVFGLVIFIKYLADKIMNYVGKSSELMLIFAICFAVVMSSVSSAVGFGKELGGLLAGMALASTPIRDNLASRLASLRDFLLLFFFVTLGSTFEIKSIANYMPEIIILSLFILIGNPIIVMLIMKYMGYKKRTGFLAGLTVAQISEFSLIFMKMGEKMGHLSSTYTNIVTFVGIITIAMCTYMITYSHQIYNFLEPYLNFFEKKNIGKEVYKNKMLDKKYDIIIFGLGRYGSAIYDELINKKFKVLGVDFDPETVRKYKRKKKDVIFGDVCEVEFLGSLPVDKSKWCIFATAYRDTGLTEIDPRFILLTYLRSINYKGNIAIRADYEHEVAFFNKLKAGIVLNPLKYTAHGIAKLIKK